MTATEKNTNLSDIYEQTAQALEDGQQKRFRAHRTKEIFWNDTELEIFAEIKAAREKSKTYHPDNER